MIALNEEGYGTKKGIPSTLIAAATFDNITTLIWFGIVKKITFSKADSEIKGISSNIGMSVAWLFIHVIVGLVVGFLVGLSAYFFKYIDSWKHQIWLKAIYSVTIAISFVIISEYSTFKDSKFIACFAFGYTCFRFWGANKPVNEIATMWTYIQPCLFGTIGGSLNIKLIRGSDVAGSFAIFIVAGIVKQITVVLMTLKQGFLFKEQALMAISWTSKGTVAATLAA